MNAHVMIWFFRGFFILGATMSLWGAMRPAGIVRLTARWYSWSFRLNGFEADIRPTKKAEKIVSIWCFLYAVIFAAASYFSFAVK